jgi:protein-S-isoprenylcysteine O-methyltransferase Ste14
VPVPETHLGLLAVGVGMSVLGPRRITSGHSIRRVGWPLIVLGVALAVWATRTAGNNDLERPDQVVTSGPYSASRHPMYVAWTLIYLGVALVLNTAWLLLLVPLLAALIHREAQREEERLEEAFGSEYRAYRGRVRRYL